MSIVLGVVRTIKTRSLSAHVVRSGAEMKPWSGDEALAAAWSDQHHKPYGHEVSFIHP
jgi:hypothetical protein